MGLELEPNEEEPNENDEDKEEWASDVDTKGLWVSDVDSEGSASTASPKIEKEDQLVGVDTTVVRGLDFDSAMDILVKAGSPTKLTFYRGSPKFLYGKTAPEDSWYEQMLQNKVR